MSRTHKRVKRNKKEDLLRNNIDGLLVKLTDVSSITNRKLISDIVATIRILQGDVFELQDLVWEEQERANNLAAKFYFLRKDRSQLKRGRTLRGSRKKATQAAKTKIDAARYKH